MTTFPSRKLMRDELVSLFTANGSWQDVYGYFPSVNEIKGKTPVLIIRSQGTSQTFSNFHTNPRVYQFVVSSYVLAYSESDAWTSANAEDKADELDAVVCQVIRDNADGTAYSDILQLDDGFSNVQDAIIEGLPYIVETRTVIARLVNGAV